jgi:hypothetical protein
MTRRSILPAREAFRRSSKQMVSCFLTTHLVWFNALAKAKSYVNLFYCFVGHTHKESRSGKQTGQQSVKKIVSTCRSR